eukprot:7142029-Heterocapsa_arctica.AAC.1
MRGEIEEKVKEGNQEREKVSHKKYRTARRAPNPPQPALLAADCLSPLGSNCLPSRLGWLACRRAALFPGASRLSHAS